MSGTYEEALSTGGKLIVTAAGWHIWLYEPGPDLRYNGESYRLSPAEAAALPAILSDALARYEELGTTLGAGQSFTETVAGGVTVRVGGHWPGVSVRGYRTFVVRSSAGVAAWKTSMEFAEARAAEVRAALFRI